MMSTGLCLLAIAWPTCAMAGGRLPEHIRFLCTFEAGPHACEGAENPFVAAGNVSLTDSGTNRGKALHLAGQEGKRVLAKSAFIVDGRNVPANRGTIGARFRFTGKRHWNDNKRTWLLVLVPDVVDTVERKEKGTALAVFKDTDNTLALGVYDLHDGRLPPNLTPGHDVAEPDRVPLRLPTGGLGKSDWARVRFGFGQNAGRVWLGLNDKLKSAPVRFRPSRFRCLLVGSPPMIIYVKSFGLEGDVDDLLIDARTPVQAQSAGFDIPASAPPMAVPPVRRVEAVFLKGSPVGERTESVLRSHLGHLVMRQERGGWAYCAAWPSGLWFGSAKYVVPRPRGFFTGAKDGNSAFAALMLLAGYMTLGEQDWLDAAERTAHTLMSMQYPDGHWPYWAVYQEASRRHEMVIAHEIAPLEDHVQSHPITLLWLLHNLTGKAAYKTAAERGVAFVLKAQNPNGAWSHHYNTKLGCGQASQRKYLRTGELNDDATADQMTIMLMAYRRTGDPKYLRSYLRAADWIASAFIDAKAKGWAQQYDEHNQPIQARHFEPAAVSLEEGIDSAPLMLMQAYRLTGDARYRTPLDTWRKWMLEHRVFTNPEKTKWGWHLYYDIHDGKPFLMAKRKRIAPDPHHVRDWGFTRILRMIERIDRPLPTATPSVERARDIIKGAEGLYEHGTLPAQLRPNRLVDSFDWHAGTWLYGKNTPTGPKFNVATVRSALITWSVFLRRQVKGQIPIDHRLSAMTRDQWANPFYYVVPPAQLEQPLTREQIAAARSVNP